MSARTGSRGVPVIVLVVLVRLLSGLAIVAVATYYLLASIPFAFYHFLQFPHFWWMPLFIRIHPLLMLGGAAGMAATMNDLPAPWRPWARYVGIAGTAIAAAMLATSLVSGLQSYENAGALYMAPMLLMSVAGCVDLLARCGAEPVTAPLPADGRGLVASAALAGGLAASVYFVVSTLGGRDPGDLLWSEVSIVGGASVVGHAALFALVMIALVITQRLARRARWSARLETVAVGAVAAAFVAAVVRRTLLVTLPLTESQAVALAAVMGAGVVLHWQALLLRRVNPSSSMRDPIRQTLLVIPQTRRGRLIGTVVCSLIVVVAVGVLPGMITLADWGSALQKLLVMTAWLGLMGLILSLPPGQVFRSRLAAGVVLCVGLMLTVAASTARANRPLADAHRRFDVDLAVARYATLDMSMMALLDLARPVMADKGFFNTLFIEGDRTYYASAVRATPLRLMNVMRSTETYRPHIFVIVVDSLRPDYLSPYNPDVTFTPNIGAFARESLVMRNAFATYTGTALSQPSIWAGGLIQRYEYVKPFSVVNNLDRLVSDAGYRKYISMDKILGLLLEDRTNLTVVDAGVADPNREEDAFKFDLCMTLRELTADLDRDAQNPAPAFFYAQPQNLHLRVLTPKGWVWVGTRIGTKEFYEPAVVAIKRLDACFGDFVSYLKARNMYDDSIIVLTSDHGDAYGEGKRFGHAFYVTPEVLRVPIIMHVPDRLLASRRSDADAVALLTDITPTLYALLGYGPLERHPLLGRPFVNTPETSIDRPNLYFVQSSYSRVFGLLLNNGEQLYAANANSLTEELYDLANGQRTLRSLPATDRVVYRRWLLEQIAVLNDYYAPGSTRAH